MSLAWVLVYTGKHGSFEGARRRDAELTGGDAVAALKQRGIVFHYLCHDDAQRDYTAAISVRQPSR